MSSDTPWQSPSGSEDPSARPAEPRYGAYATPAAGQPAPPDAAWAQQGPGAFTQAPAGPGYPSLPGTTPQAPPTFVVAPRPGIIPLRPLSTTEIIGGAFESLRANPRAMFVPAIVVMAVIGLLSALHTLLTSQSLYSAMESTAQQTDLSSDQAIRLVLTSLGSVVSYVPTMVLTSLASAILTGLLIVAVSRSVLGRVASPGEVWQRTKGRVWALIGQVILVNLIVGAATAVVAVLSLVVLVPLLVSSSPSASTALAAATGFIILAVVGMLLSAFLGVRLSLASAALILENIGVIEAIRRSWALTRGYFWKVLGTLLLATIITVAATGILSGVTGTLVGLTAALTSGGALPTVGAVSVFIGSVLDALVLPFSASVTALVYIDLRMRQEGLDVELRQAVGAL